MKRKACEFEKGANPITLEFRCTKVVVCYPRFLLPFPLGEDPFCYVSELDLSFLSGLT